MILVFDIGNSNITIGAYDKDELAFTARLITDSELDAESYADKIQGILFARQKTAEDIVGAAVCSVVPAVTRTISMAVEKLSGSKPLIVDSSTDYGLKICMDNPRKVGTDLLVGASCAAFKYEAPLCVIDLGTFTTLCYVSRNHEYQGTIIIPGIRTTGDSYSRGAQLFEFEIKSPGQLLGTNTEGSMLSGLMHGTAAMLDGLLDRIEQEKGELKSIVITGGFSEMIEPLLQHKVIIDEELLLSGLLRLYYSNIFG